MRDFVTLPSFNAVTVGQTATLDLPVTGRYHQILLKYGTDTNGGVANQATIEAEVGEIRVKVNGKVQRRATAEEIFDMYAYRGIPFENGFIPIFFSEPWRRTPAGEDSLAWGMADVSTFQLEVDIINNLGQAPTLSASAVKDAFMMPMGQISKWRKHVIGVSATGIVNVTTLPKTDAYYALHAVSANISDVAIKVDQRERFVYTLAQAQYLQKQQGWAPVTGYFHIDFTDTARVSDALLMVSEDGQRRIADFQLDFNMSSAASFTLLSEQIGPRD